MYIIDNVRHPMRYAIILKLSSDGGDSGSKKLKRVRESIFVDVFGRKLSSVAV